MCGFLRVVWLILVFCQIGFEAFCELTPGKHDASSTTFAFKADIRAETRHRPLIGTTRMLFAEAQVVVEAEVGEHGKIIDKTLWVEIDRVTNIINES